jgi:hypothetical protein
MKLSCTRVTETGLSLGSCVPGRMIIVLYNGLRKKKLSLRAIQSLDSLPRSGVLNFSAGPQRLSLEIVGPQTPRRWNSDQVKAPCWLDYVQRLT